MLSQFKNLNYVFRVRNDEAPHHDEENLENNNNMPNEGNLANNNDLYEITEGKLRAIKS